MWSGEGAVILDTVIKDGFLDMYLGGRPAGLKGNHSDLTGNCVPRSGQKQERVGMGVTGPARRLVWGERGERRDRGSSADEGRGERMVPEGMRPRSL